MVYCHAIVHILMKCENTSQAQTTGTYFSRFDVNKNGKRMYIQSTMWNSLFHFHYRKWCILNMHCCNIGSLGHFHFSGKRWFWWKINKKNLDWITYNLCICKRKSIKKSLARQNIVYFNNRLVWMTLHFETY